MSSNWHCKKTTGLETLEDFRATKSGWYDGGSLTCDKTLASIPSWQGMDAIRGIRDLISPIFDSDGVTPCHVWYIGHCVRPISVVPDVRLLWFSLRILKTHGQEVTFFCLVCCTETSWVLAISGLSVLPDKLVDLCILYVLPSFTFFFFFTFAAFLTVAGALTGPNPWDQETINVHCTHM